MTSHQAKHFAKVSEKLAEMPNTRAKLSAGGITLEHVSYFPIPDGFRKNGRDRRRPEPVNRPPGPDPPTRNIGLWNPENPDGRATAMTM